ncbi:MAG: hypothetical protein FWD84_03935 [Oscillospiraceae bacterium]|nr:hypothetical protein [Oscillospiraceae bacterium]
MENESYFIIRPHKLIFWCGVFSCVTYSIFFALMPVLFADQIGMFWLTYALLLPLLAASVFLIVYGKRWRVLVDGNKIDCQFVIRRRQLYFQDIEKVKLKKPQRNTPEQLILYTSGKRLFSISESYRGYPLMKQRLEHFSIPFSTK